MIDRQAKLFLKRVQRRVSDFIVEGDVLRPGGLVLVAASAGPDSTAAVLILQGLGYDLRLAHFDHMLRTREEAEGDAAFVRTLAEQHRLPVAFGAEDVKAFAATHHLSREDAARRARYGFLKRECERVGASVVVVGHTASDQAETVLLHLARGSGLDGLRGMPPRATWPFGEGPALARPLLCLWRDETRRYCREMGVRAREDPSNLLLEPVRNRVRHEVLPLLRDLNPRIEEALVRLSRAATLDAGYIEAAALGVWQRLAQLRADRVSFPREEFAALNPALMARLLRLAVSQLLGSHADLEAVHVGDLMAALAKRKHRLSLPHGLTAVLEPKWISIIRGEPERTQAVLETPLNVPGATIVGEWLVEAEIVPFPKDFRSADSLEAFLDSDAVGEPVIVRGRRPGDRLRPLGLDGEKKVQDIFVDAKVPLAERDGVPLLCGSGGIVWVVGHCLDARYALGPTSVKALHVRFNPRQI